MRIWIQALVVALAVVTVASSRIATRLLCLGILLMLATQTHALAGTYYGTTRHDGAHGAGTVIAVLPNWHRVVLYNFCSVGNCYDGADPSSNIVPLADGSLIGTTAHGGYGAGVLFQLGVVNGQWTEIVTVPICTYFRECAHFGSPSGTLTQIRPGVVEGVISGGKYGRGMIFTYNAAYREFVNKGTFREPRVMR